MGMGDGFAGRVLGSSGEPTSVPDMSEQGYASSLVYAGDASWQSILILRTDIFRTIWARRC